MFIRCSCIDWVNLVSININLISYYCSEGKATRVRLRNNVPPDGFLVNEDYENFKARLESVMKASKGIYT